MSKNKYEKTFAHLQARNIRYLFIVDSKISSKHLFELFTTNQRFWGGRYNPIIPSYDGVIPEKYIKLAQQFDPDYIVFNQNIDINGIIQYFNPIEYIPAASDYAFYRMEGIEASYLLNTNYGYNTLLREIYLYKSLPELYNFYKLNFGFIDGEDNEAIKKYNVLEISDHNQAKLNEFLTYSNILFVSKLSRFNVKRPYLMSPFKRTNNIELIVADENNQFEDLIYFWNRQLYYHHESYSLNQIYITKQQVDQLIKDKSQEFFFSSLCGNAGMTITSQSLNSKELTLVTKKLNEWQRYVTIKMVDKPEFPYEVTGIWANDDYEEPFRKQSLTGRKDVIQLPDLSFLLKEKIVGKWMVDIELERDGHTHDKNWLKVPQKQYLTNYFTDVQGRVNADNYFSFTVSDELKSMSVNILTDEEIFNIVLKSAYNKVGNSIVQFKTSDAGMRLASLLNLFNHNFNDIENLVLTKFWFNVFRDKSFGGDKRRLKGCKGIVSYFDLVKEYEDSFKDDGFGFSTEFLAKDDNELKEQLSDLVNISAYFIGNKIKCKNCGSNHWYGLPELNNLISCKGCMRGINLQVEQQPYYKLNDVVRNNLLSNSGSKNDIHGNYTVLSTLNFLREISQCTFFLLPCQDFFKLGSATATSDIDIICICDGDLIIGEAKNSVSEFNTKEIDNLIFLGNNIHPAKIILAFCEGETTQLADNIKKLQEGLANKSIKIIPHKVEKPFLKSRNLRPAMDLGSEPIKDENPL